MCGINVIFRSPHVDKISAMTNAIRHRGPDEQYTWVSNSESAEKSSSGNNAIEISTSANNTTSQMLTAQVALGSARLKIIDLEGGSMPFHSKCGRYHLVYNGEIYNYEELRAQVANYPFSSKSDTEVLFALLQLQGVKAIERLNGMFSFAFYDAHENKLIIGRDRLGIKPLFYAQQGESLYFSSEISPLLLIPGLDKGLNQQALSNYLSTLCVNTPHTFYPSIARFPAAHYAIIQDGKMQLEKYWQLSFEKSQDSQAELYERIRKSLASSVKRRLVADVPLGVFLSGGVDSSIICKSTVESSTLPVKSFCLGFAGGLDERKEAALTAEILGTEHHDHLLDPAKLWQDIPDICAHFAEPFAGGLPLFFLSREMKRHVTVALSGTGGDEMFGNYGRIQHLRPRLGMLQAIKSLLRLYQWNDIKKMSPEKIRYLLVHGVPLGHSHHEKNSHFRHWQKNELLLAPQTLATDMLFDDEFYETKATDLEDKLFDFELKHQLSDEFLYSQDILSMAHSLEVRVPFLDHEFVELMASVPSSIRSHPGDPKKTMREIFAHAIPDHSADNQKKGFMIPYGEWLRTHLKPMGEKLLAKPLLEDQALFRQSSVQKYWQEHQAGGDHSYKLWTILMFQLWYAQREKIDLGI
ncbi:MAG: asparagine synthase (glutamine-hydrolyzing) [Planctomycetes bacterium]|nr:asparagine synthase (glutamine-hydrolyzing) [Planctomycetota bacterium]